MKIVDWKFESLEIKMVDIGGELYCTSKAVCEALGVKSGTLRECYRSNPDEFESLSVRNSDAKALHKIKAELGIKRLRKDMRLWSEDDMLTFAFMVKGTRAREARRDFRRFIKQHAKLTGVSQEQHKRELNELREEVTEMVQSMKSFSHGAKSTIGRMNNLGNRAGNVIQGNFPRTA